MRDSELRGLILEALYNQRRKDLVNLDQELGALPTSRNSSVLMFPRRQMQVIDLGRWSRPRASYRDTVPIG
jgi:hypothetical protein